MTRATLRQRLFGLTKKDRSKLKLTEQEAVAAALAEIDPANPSAVDYPDAYAAAFVHRGEITWCVHPAKYVKCATTFAYVDDETGRVLHVQKWGRGIGEAAISAPQEEVDSGASESAGTSER